MRKNSENSRLSAPPFTEEALGRLVRSRAGHDRGTLLVIVGIADEEHVLVADGRLRTLEKPKKKKLRHLEVGKCFSEELQKKLASSSPVQNAELRKFILSASEQAAEEEKQVGR